MASYDFKISFALEHAPVHDVAHLLKGLALVHLASQPDIDDRMFLYELFGSRNTPLNELLSSVLVLNRLDKGSLVGQIMDWVFGDKVSETEEAETESVVSAIKALPDLRSSEDAPITKVVNLLRSQISIEMGPERLRILRKAVHLLAMASEGLRIESSIVEISGGGSVATW